MYFSLTMFSLRQFYFPDNILNTISRLSSIELFIRYLVEITMLDELSFFNNMMLLSVFMRMCKVCRRLWLPQLYKTVLQYFSFFLLVVVVGSYPCIVRAFIKWCPGAPVVAPSIGAQGSVYSWPTLVILHGMSKWMAQLWGSIFKVRTIRRYINLSVPLYRIDHVLAVCLPASLSAWLSMCLSACLSLYRSVALYIPFRLHLRCM